jgi:hypothetical protein
MLLRIIAFFLLAGSTQMLIPIRSADRSAVGKIQLTAIGKFGIPRKERKNVRSHLHTGIDIKRPGNNYDNEPVYPIAKGIVISKRTDGPYAQLILEHELDGRKFWTLYEHIAGISVKVNDVADPQKPMARFMNKKELNTYGWQFDHFHLEVLKTQPLRIKPDKFHPERFFSSFTLSCYETRDLEKHYPEPLKFLAEHSR